MSDDNVKHLLGTVDDLTESIRKYDGHFNVKPGHETCVMSAWRDSAFGILLSLFTLNHITAGEFHRRLHEINSAFYEKV